MFPSSTLFTTPVNSNKDETTITGVKPEIMDLVIDYAYLRDLKKIDEKNVHEMLVISDYLGILGLMKYCVDFIIDLLSPENCIITWLMSR